MGGEEKEYYDDVSFCRFARVVFTPASWLLWPVCPAAAAAAAVAISSSNGIGAVSPNWSIGERERARVNA